MKTVTTILAAAAIFGAVQVSTHAVPVTIFGEDQGNGELGPPALHPNSDAAEAAFLALLTGTQGTEDFESFVNNQGAPLILNFPGAGVAVLNGTGSIQAGANNVGRFPISGANYWASGTQFSISFLQPVAAIGFYAVDVGDFNGQITLSIDGVNSDSVVVIPNSTGIPGGGVLYFGYIDTANPFTSIVFGNTNPQAGGVGDGFGFDDMTIGNRLQIKTPDLGSTLLLLGAAIGGLGIVRRFKA